MSNIIHMQIPLNEKAQPIIDLQKIEKIHNQVREYLSEDKKVARKYNPHIYLRQSTRLV